MIFKQALTVTDLPPDPTNNKMIVDGVVLKVTENQKKQIDDYATQMAQKYNIDPNIFKKLVSIESEYDAKAKSKAGAIGLAQLKPNAIQESAKYLGKQLNPNNWKENLEMGAAILAHNVKVFGNYTAALAAYNQGVRAVSNFLTGKKPLKTEGQNYLQRMHSENPYNQYKSGDPHIGNMPLTFDNLKRLRSAKLGLLGKTPEERQKNKMWYEEHFGNTRKKTPQYNLSEKLFGNIFKKP